MPYYPQPVQVKKAGTVIGSRPAINLIEGSNVTLTVADDAAGNEVDVTVAAAPGDFQPAIVTNNYYYPPNVAFNTQSIYGGYLTAFPIWFSHTETWTRVGIKVTATEAGKVCRLGIYANGANNLPGALITDFGTVSFSATGNLEITISATLQANTVYWLAHATDTNGAAPTNGVCGMTYYLNGSNAFSGPNWGLGSAAPVDAAGYITGFGPGRAFTYGALPDPFGAPTGNFDSPAIWLRKV